MLNSLDPGILVIVDECHSIWDKKTAEWWAMGAREWRKLGGAIWAATQAADLKAAFASSDVLRTSLVSGNGIALRTVSDVQQNVFPGLKVKLDQLPNDGGHGYTIDEGDQGHTRTAPFRARFLVGQAAVDEGRITLPDGVGTAEQWFDRLGPTQQLDADTAKAGGAPFANRLIKAALEQAALEAMFSGDVELPDFAAEFTLPAAAQPTSTDDDGDVEGARVIRFPRFGQPVDDVGEPDEDEPNVDGPGPRKPEQLTAAQSRVWDVIAAGRTRPAEIAAALGVSAAAVHKQLASACHRQPHPPRRAARHLRDHQLTPPGARRGHQPPCHALPLEAPTRGSGGRGVRQDHHQPEGIHLVQPDPIRIS